jgi:peroxiredoxin
MSKTSSTMLPLGTAAPAFSLPDVVTGRSVSLADFADKKALLVMFICNHCPYVIHVRDELMRLARDYAGRGVGTVAISSNDSADYPEDAADKMKTLAEQLRFPFPYCHDESQEVAKAYTAACTPDFFLFDQNRKLVYRGQLDGTRPRQDPPTGADLRAALDATLAGQPVNSDQKPSLGCNIKWRAGNAPAYFG